MSGNKPKPTDAEYGLIVQQAGVHQQDLVKSLSLILNYLYGFNILLARSVAEGTGLVAERGQTMRHVFVVQDEPIGAQDMAELGRNGELPVFILQPQSQIGLHLPLVASADNVHLVSWEEATGPDSNLRKRIEDVFQDLGIGGLFDRAQHVSYRVLQQRVEKRLSSLHTLPTMPEVVMRIMAVISDVDSTSQQLEEVLRSDPSIVHKLLQVVNTPVFSGTGRRGEWTLHEAIVRLGRRKLGSVALQIKLINSLIVPEESNFDMRRFWIHSVGCAHIADAIYTEKLVPFDDDIGVDDYWIASLLHDIGELVLGFFFWNYFERLEELIGDTGMTFREAEIRLGDIVTHQQVGQLLLLGAGMGEGVFRCVGAHHEPEALPSPLMCLVHLADNLSKDLGLGYIPGERGLYDAAVLRALQLDTTGLDQLRATLAKSIVAEIRDVVDRCTAVL